MNLLDSSQIIETLSTINVSMGNIDEIVLRTFRPVPKMNYLTKQQIGANKIDTTGVWLW